MSLCARCGERERDEVDDSYCRECRSFKARLARKRRIAREGLEAVREAEREAVKRHRSNSEVRKLEHKKIKARRRALSRLAERHREEYESLVNEERARAGIEPLRGP